MTVSNFFSSEKGSPHYINHWTTSPKTKQDYIDVMQSRSPNRTCFGQYQLGLISCAIQGDREMGTAISHAFWWHAPGLLLQS